MNRLSAIYSLVQYSNLTTNKLFCTTCNIVCCIFFQHQGKPFQILLCVIIITIKILFYSIILNNINTSGDYKTQRNKLWKNKVKDYTVQTILDLTVMAQHLNVF